MTADPSRPQDDTKVASHKPKMPPPQGDNKTNDGNGGSGSDNKTGSSPAMTSSSPFGSGYDLQHHLSQPWVRKYRTTISAGLSSVVSTTCAFPLDSMKTRMQTYRYAGFMDCLRQTYQNEGLAGFFRGVTAPMASVTVVRTVSFTIYQRAAYVYSDWIDKNFGYNVINHAQTPGTYPNLWTTSCFGVAGATAGSCITLIACPFELTKISAQVAVLLNKKSKLDPKMQEVAASYQNKGTLKTMANIVHHRGITGLYTGYSLHLLRDTLGTGLYFMTYESSKQLLTTFTGNSAQSNTVPVFIAGGLCGVVSWSLIYPIDSAKSIYQRNCLLHSKEERVAPVKIQFFRQHMYRGLGVSMVRSCLLNAIFFSSFELWKKYLGDEDKDKERDRDRD